MSRIRAHSLALVAAALLAGCGGGDDEPESRLSNPQGGNGDELAGGTSADELAGGGSRGDNGDERGGGEGGDQGGAAGEGGDQGGGESGGRGGDGGEAGGGDSGSGGSGGSRRSGGTPKHSTPGSDPARGESEDVTRARAFMVDYLDRLNRSDPTICTDLFTQNHVERVTRMKGQAAVEKCRRDIAATRVKVALKDLKSVERIGEGRLKVTSTLESGGRELPSILELVEDGGRLKVDKGG